MALPSPPVGLDLAETQASRVIGVSVLTYMIALISVILRLVCRRLVRARLWWDDACILVALLAATGMLLIVDAYMIPDGLGKHIWAGSPTSALVWAQGLWIQEMMYPLVITASKFSLLAFYWRLFAGNLRLPILVLGSVVSAWGIALVFITIFQCVPPAAFWEQFSPSLSPTTKASFVCGVDDKKFFIGNSVPNIVTDLVILLLPMKIIWGLHLPISKRIAVSTIILLGVFIVGVSIARFTYLMSLDLTSPDVTWNFVDVQVWTNVECCIGIACACMPTLGPLYNLLISDSKSTKHASASKSYGERYGVKAWKYVPRGDEQSHVPKKIQYLGSASDLQHLNATTSAPNSTELEEIANGVTVRTEFPVQS